MAVVNGYYKTNLCEIRITKLPRSARRRPVGEFTVAIFIFIGERVYFHFDSILLVRNNNGSVVFLIACEFL